MDLAKNPFVAVAGASPPLLAGRERELAAFTLVLKRMGSGTPSPGLLLPGMLGVGKTSLVNRYELLAMELDWVPITREVTTQVAYPVVFADGVADALRALKPAKAMANQIQGRLAGLGTFGLKDPAGFELSYTPTGDEADGELRSDFTQLFRTLGDVAQSKGRGVVFLLDEAHLLAEESFISLAVAFHDALRRALPVTVVMTGLPPLLLRGPSYSERLFEWVEIGALSRVGTNEALRVPMKHAGIEWESSALDHAWELSKGFPFVLQELGRRAWEGCSSTQVTREDAMRAGVAALTRLDADVFGGYLRRCRSNGAVDFLRSMAELPGPPYALSEIGSALSIKPKEARRIRDELLEDELLWSMDWEHVCFTVPLFSDYLARKHDAGARST